MTQYLWY